MTAVYVLRHPETTWNVAQRYQGRLDAPLSPHGWEQCRITADVFRGCSTSAVYSSPMRRALDLARAIASATAADLVVDERLTEIGQGAWEGLHRSEIAARFPDLMRQWYRRPDEVRFPYGESLHDVHVRSQSALADIFAAQPDENVCLVTHSVVVQVLAASALSLELRYLHRLHVSNAGISLLSGTSAPGRLMTLNSTDHLIGGPVAQAGDEPRMQVSAGRKAS